MKGVELRKISKTYPGGVRALIDIDLRIAPGEFFTLLGPSGCGKTTLLRTVAGFERQDAGTVLVGERVMDDVPPQRRNLGVVFQSHAVFPHLSVFENVAFGLRARGVAETDVRRRVQAALERVRLADLGERTPDRLSGGQQQRVGLARALVIEPDVLLMDEPLSSLDARLRLEMRDEVRALQRSLGITTVYVTHDQEEALAVSDRVAVLHAGRVEQVGTPWEVYADPSSATVAGFVGRISVLDAQAARDLLGVGLPAGGRAAIRPEHVRIEVATSSTIGAAAATDTAGVAGVTAAPAATAATGGDGRPGVIAHVAFTGALVTYHVACGPVTLLCEQHRPSGGSLLRPGTAVRVTADPAHVLRFDAAGRRLRA